jgi:hypothetical protein
MNGVLDPTLDVADGSSRVALVPAPVQSLGGDAELHNQVAAQILRFGLAALFLPQSDQRRLVWAHNDPGVRTADELAAVVRLSCEWLSSSRLPPGSKMLSAASRHPELIVVCYKTHDVIRDAR